MATATITGLGLQAGTDRTTYATWSWGQSNTKNYEILWHYITSDGKWFVGNQTTTDLNQSTYNAPEHAVGVGFSVKPLAKTRTINGIESAYWTASWATAKTYYFAAKPPAAPSAPTVTVIDYQLTAKLSGLDDDVKEVQFEIAANDATTYKSGSATPKTGVASYSCTVSVGNNYKARCRVKVGGLYSEWSGYSGEAKTKPSASNGITSCTAVSPTAVKLEWTAASSATSYDIEWATSREYLGASNATTIINGVKSTLYTITGLPSGNTIYFRVRGVNEEGESSWTEAVSLLIGAAPQPPTTWMSTSTAVIGETVMLYWFHNTQDNSRESDAQLELTINGTTNTITLGEPNTDDGRYYALNTSMYQDGAEIRWRVRTRGVMPDWSDWSAERVISVFAPPTLGFSITDINNQSIYTVTSFPFYVVGITGPNNQTPIGYHVSVVSNDSYECRDELGNVKMVTKGSEIYSGFFDIKENLNLEMTPDKIDLENNMSYSVSCMVTMDSGLTVSETLDFNVAWKDETLSPNAEIAYDPETLCVHIRPYCESASTLILSYQVTYDPSTGNFYRTNTVLENPTGKPINGCYTEDGYVVYYAGTNLYFCIVDSGIPAPLEDVTMSVYRRDYDGRFVEIGSNLNNEENIFVTDPHPSLDYARYRVVARSDKTGAISYNDIPGYPIGEKAIIIQWDETWDSFEENEVTQSKDRPWAGSMLKLPYNIDVSDDNTVDVSLVNYIGRSHPVSYYGTQLGITSNWNVEIPKSDKNTLYGLRRLAIYMGDVYVREPSGSGYWANITVSFSQTHCETTIPVSFKITRVEGGV